MVNDQLSTEALSRRIGAIVGPVQTVLRRETGEEYDPRLIEDSIRTCVANALSRLEEGLLESFTTPAHREFQEMAVLLERGQPMSQVAVQVEEAAQLAQEYGDESLFHGYRPFSKAKLAAMIEYLTSKGHFVYKTSLNKLLFYSDLTYFYLRNQGMSGAVYYNRPFGPVADPAEPILNELIEEEKIKVDPRTKTFETAAPSSADILSSDEKKVLDWVAQTYGPMSAGAISELSHTEMAYKYTDPNDPIAYGYAKVLKKLPPKDLLSH